MGKIDKEIIIEKFVTGLDADFQNIKLLYKFINIDDPRRKKALDAGMKMLSKKIKALKECETLEDYSEHLKVKKILRDMDDYEK